MKRGYLPLYRKIQDHPFYKEKRVFSKYEAWIDILMEARHKIEPKDVLFGMTVVVCGHGQSLYSLRTWGKRWGWSGKKVSRFFILLEKLNQIKCENVTVTTRITVLNYKIYDIKCHTDVTQGKHEGNTTETQPKHDCPTNNNGKNVKHDKHDEHDELREHLHKKIKESKIEKYTEILNEFYDYRMGMTGKGKYQTNRGINGLIKNVNTLTDENLDIEKCLILAMEKNWLSPELHYFEKYKSKLTIEKETIVICLDEKVFIDSKYQAGGEWQTSNTTYINMMPDFVDDDEREEVELNTSRFVAEYCEGGF